MTLLEQIDKLIAANNRVVSDTPTYEQGLYDGRVEGIEAVRRLIEGDSP